MRTISIKFTDQSWEFVNNDNYIIDFLKNHYNVVLSDNPEFLFYSDFGNDFLNYPQSIRIWINHENVRPNFNYADYAYSSDRLQFGERYLERSKYIVKPDLSDNIDYANRLFCNFIYHQTDFTSGQKLRVEFCKALQKYKRVDCPGRALNNMQGDILPRFAKPGEGQEATFASKRKFLSKYKFTIAFENTSYPGYITEKLYDPIIASSVPIYFGDPDIEIDFNPDAFIIGKWSNNFDEVIEKIIYYDTHDDEYMKMLRTPAMQPTYIKPKKDFYQWLLDIIDHGKIYRQEDYKGLWCQPLAVDSTIINSVYDNILEPLEKLTSTEAGTFTALKNDLIFGLENKMAAYLAPLRTKIEQLNSLKEVFSHLGVAHQLNESEICAQKAGVLESASARLAIAPDSLFYLNDPELAHQYRELFALLWPQDVSGGNKIRVGGPHDGGYVMLEPGHDGVAVSIGIGNHAPWDLEMAQRGWQVFQFDGTVEASPCQHRHINFFSKNLTAQTSHGPEAIHLADILAMLEGENDIILQMDIEGAEWDVLENATESQLLRFSQIIVEFHGLRDKNLLPRCRRIFEKLCSTHVPVHFHYNNTENPYVFEDFLVNGLWEISFVRRDDLVFSPSHASFPCELDSPNITRFPDLFIGKFDAITPRNYCQEPPRSIPENLRRQYTMNGKIPVQSFYLDDRRSAPVRNTRQIYERTFKAIKDGTFQYYGLTYDYLLAALRDFPIAHKQIIIAGLAGCSCDAIAILHDACEVIAVDYNPPYCEHELVRSIGMDEFNKLSDRPEACISISSFEHDGLGRYGDPLDPEGDLLAMRGLKTRMAANGLLYLSVPVGRDLLAWNAHRIYGRLRLPKLLEGWAFLSSYGMSGADLDRPEGDWSLCPVFVLSNDPQALNIPANATPLQKDNILYLAANGKFNRQFYIERNSDVLSGQMDVISHYVFYGALEGRSPDPDFDPISYMEKFPGIDWRIANPYVHYLNNTQNK